MIFGLLPGYKIKFLENHVQGDLFLVGANIGKGEENL